MLFKWYTKDTHGFNNEAFNIKVTAPYISSSALWRQSFLGTIQTTFWSQRCSVNKTNALALHMGCPSSIFINYWCDPMVLSTHFIANVTMTNVNTDWLVWRSARKANSVSNGKIFSGSIIFSHCCIIVMAFNILYIFVYITILQHNVSSSFLI